MNRLKEIRKAHNETQTFVASKVIFRTVKTYRKYETSTDFEEIPLKDAIALANHYNVTIDYLCGLSDCTRTDSHYIQNEIGLSQAAQDTLQVLNKHSLKYNDFGVSASEMDIINFMLSDKTKFGNMISTLRLYMLKNEFSELCYTDEDTETKHMEIKPLPFKWLLAGKKTLDNAGNPGYISISLNTENIIETSALETLHKYLYEMQAAYIKQNPAPAKSEKQLPGQMSLNDYM